MNIPTWPTAVEREAELLRTVLESPQWGGFHPFVTEFEQSFAAYQHAAHGISAFNGTVTLELALEVLGIGAGDEVIVPAISFISTATAVSRAGAIPVFVDIEHDSFNLDPQRVREALSPKTRAVMAVHFGGTMCNIAEISRSCREHNLFLIEDAAHAQGSEWNGQRAGSFGIAGSFSFQNGKVLCSGEGGILVSSDDAFAERARSIANCGRVPGVSFYEHRRLGTNFRLTGFQAAVLLAQFERLPAQIQRRTSHARLLKHLLEDVEEIVWQAQGPEISQNSFYLLIGHVRGPSGARDAFLRQLTRAGVPCTPFYPHTLYANPAYRHAACRVLPCPVSEQSIGDAFWLPHRVLLAEEETIREIAGILRAAVAAELISTGR
ncbi:MAG TPA: DegT/DnrJ/EryC1/StrS family aminotransferase [Bryobacteraceae bacterium]|jgi:dTDP-4-amino-4,6-dideoxygalactose transaminase|nr:DegT/DnrJ/EryC1/StrS family aminotransferase [Bryobacteraceae bacterium]